MRQLAALLGLALLAGCLTPSAADEPVEPASAKKELEDVLAALEAGEPSANLKLVGEWRSSGSEVAAHGDILWVMRAGTATALDVSDLSDIEEVGVVQGMHGVLDLKLSHDGKYLFIGDDQEGTISEAWAVQGAVGGFAGGLYVYDVTDPAQGELVDFLPIGPRRGPHMVFYHQYPDGREVVFGANGDISISEFDRDAGTLTPLARYEPDLVTGYNREPYVVDALYQGWAHDMFVQTEPDGRVLMYVANWDAGLRIVDVTDPSAPVELGGWNDFGEGESGNLHTVAADWIGDRRIVVGSAEVGFAVVGGLGYAQGAEPGVLYVWDATDPADIRLLGTWENPEAVKAGGRPALDEGVMSTHNLQFEDGLVYLAHYGLGIFVVDASTPDTWATPETLAYYREEGMSTWDVIVHRGVVFSSGREGVLGLDFPNDAVDLTSRA